MSFSFFLFPFFSLSFSLLAPSRVLIFGGCPYNFVLMVCHVTKSNSSSTVEFLSLMCCFTKSTENLSVEQLYCKKQSVKQFY